MNSLRNYIKVYFLIVIVCVVLNYHSFSSKSTGNKTAFKNIEKLASRSNGTLQHSKTLGLNKKSENEQDIRTKNLDEQKIYVNINGTKYTAIMNGIHLNNGDHNDNCKCNCNCDPNDNGEETIQLYAIDDLEDSDMNVDDIDELEQIEKPYKYIPMEIIELAHQRPARLTTTTTTTSSPPLKSLISSASSITSVLNQSPISLETITQLGLSLMLTLFIRTILGPFGSIQSRFSLSNKNLGYYNKFYMRSHNYDNEHHDSNDILSLIDKLLEKFDK